MWPHPHSKKKNSPKMGLAFLNLLNAIGQKNLLEGTKEVFGKVIKLLGALGSPEKVVIS